MLRKEEPGTEAAKRGSQGVSSSEWLPIRKELGGKGGVRDERRVVGSRVCSRRSGAPG